MFFFFKPEQNGCHTFDLSENAGLNLNPDSKCNMYHDLVRQTFAIVAQLHQMRTLKWIFMKFRNHTDFGISKGKHGNYIFYILPFYNKFTFNN